MAEAVAYHAHGTTLVFAGFTADRVTITGPSLVVETGDVTHLESPIDANGTPWREFIRMLGDAGEVSVTCHVLPGEAAVIGTRDTLVIVFPTVGVPTTGTFSNTIMTGFDITSDVAEHGTADVTFKLSGFPAWT